MNEEDRLALLRSTADGQSPMEAMRSFTATVVARQQEKPKTYDLPAPPVAQIDQATLPKSQGPDLGYYPDRRALPGGGGIASGGQIFNFQTLTQKTSGGTWQWGVVSTSDLFNSSGVFTDEQTVNGLLASTSPATTDPGWLDVGGSFPAFLFIKGTIGTWPALSDVSVETDVTFGGGKAEYAMITPSGGGSAYPSQTFFRLPLWRADSGGSGPPIFTPLCTGARELVITPRTANLSGGGSPLQVACIYPDPA